MTTATRAPAAIEPWRQSWREGVLPSLSTRALVVLRKAVLENDPRLVQGHTTVPVFEHSGPQSDAAECRGACPLAYALWQEDDRVSRDNYPMSVGEVQELFDRAMQRYCPVEFAPNPAAAQQSFFGWWDEGRPDEVRADLLEELDLALRQRREALADGVRAAGNRRPGNWTGD